MPSVVADSARRPDAIAAAPAAVIVTRRFIIAADVAYIAAVPVITGAAYHASGHDRKRRAADENGPPKRELDSHFSSASS
jgi:hypothetical protein